MKPVTVILAGRCAGAFWSIEELFSNIRRAYPGWIACTAVNAPKGGASIRALAANLRWANSLRGGDLIHQTGDIHYTVVGMWRCPAVLTIHDIRFFEEARGLRRLLFRLCWLYLPCLRASRVTVISEFTKQRLLEAARVNPSKVRVIPNCVAPEFVASPKPWPGDPCDTVGRTGPGPPTCPPCGASDPAMASSPQGAPRTSEAAGPYPLQGKVRVLQVGTTDNKNLERVIHACSGLAVRLCILGRLSESQRAQLAAHDVEYEDHQDLAKAQVVALYQSCDLLVFVSTYEGFGMPILEAQAVGRPVLTSAISPLQEVAGAGALIVDPFDTAAIRAGLVRLMEEPALRDQLVPDGFRNVARYSAESVAMQYAELYREVVGG